MFKYFFKDSSYKVPKEAVLSILSALKGKIFQEDQYVF